VVNDKKLEIKYFTEDLYFKIWQLIGDARTSIVKFRSRELHKYGVSRNYAWGLNAIKKLGDKATLSNISAYSVLEKHSVKEMLDRMLKNSLVEKKLIKGSKQPIFRLTRKGLTAYTNAHKRESIRQIMSVLTEEEMKFMQSCLTKLVNKTLQELSKSNSSNKRKTIK